MICPFLQENLRAVVPLLGRNPQAHHWERSSGGGRTMFVVEVSRMPRVCPGDERRQDRSGQRRQVPAARRASRPLLFGGIHPALCSLERAGRAVRRQRTPVL